MPLSKRVAGLFFLTFWSVFVKKLIIALMLVTGMTGLAAAKKPKLMAPPPAPVAALVPAVEPENTLVLSLSTGGTVRIQLRPDKAPMQVERTKLLTRAGFYDGIIFHRVIEGFMAQGGDPTGTGQGGSPLPDLKAEFNDLPHLRGSVSAARTDQPDTANSQFFLVFQPSLKLDGKYTVFGRVIEGMAFVDAIERGEPPASPSKIVKAWIESDGPSAARIALIPPPPAPVEAAALAPTAAPTEAPTEAPVPTP
jgi:cyclophilin family peptidyl-prolyl cis-trans isomerase